MTRRGARWSVQGRADAARRGPRGRLACSSAGSIHLKAHHQDLAHVGLVISLHVGAMYLPSLLTGRLVDRVGPIPMAWASGGILAAAALFAAVAPGDSFAARGQHGTPTTGRIKARARLAREHAAVAQHRASTLHAITEQLATSHAVVAVDDLNVAVMTRSARGSIDKPGRNVAAKAGLNRSILDASFAEMRRQLTYKTSWYRSQLLPSGRFVPTSRTCSTCGAEKANQPLSKRVYHCENCATVLDRDVNAAKNILRAALASHDAPGMEESQNARGVRIETSVALRSAKREDPPRGGPPRPSNRVRSSPPNGEAKVKANASPTN
ncbi:hypothetical protein FA951_14125 [Dermacoccus nishinomiyaensis]|nr:RNA-guided endonuclease TnpB family protein [Dermacoccus nishinomiyaensis]TJZ94697.1 hypothetical protein FA951_14125 [Dermacoccus nishinomiyaensis]